VRLELDLHLALNMPIELTQGFWLPEQAQVQNRTHYDSNLAVQPASAV
jgi:hypothetical protein